MSMILRMAIFMRIQTVFSCNYTFCRQAFYEKIYECFETIYTFTLANTRMG